MNFFFLFTPTGIYFTFTALFNIIYVNIWLYFYYAWSLRNSNGIAPRCDVTDVGTPIIFLHLIRDWTIQPYDIIFLHRRKSTLTFHSVTHMAHRIKCIRQTRVSIPTMTPDKRDMKKKIWYI